MKLFELLKPLSLTADPRYLNIEIENVSFNSTKTQMGDLFVAIQGFNSNGHDYIEDAVLAGAQAVIGELELEPTKPLSVPYFKVPNARLALAKLAAELYQHPYLNHKMIGITGTNGKTTTAYMIRHILEYAQQSCSLFGTIEKYLNGKTYPSHMTTADAVILQKWISESNDENVIMEVSSHGLTQNRVDGLIFDFALFTNLSHEHLDYHITMEHYFHSKAHLFKLLNKQGEALIHTQCSWGRKLVEILKKQGVLVYTFGQLKHDTLELIYTEDQVQPVFQVRENEETHTFQLFIPGFHNIWNAMGAILLARRKSIPFPVISKALASFSGVPGRFETYHHPNGARFIIDYAHTPDGLMQCLKAVQLYKPRRVVHIFGFRGGRDDSKWDVMMRISRLYCDETILTFDDLNELTCEELLKRYKLLNHGKTQIIEDRTLAMMHVWNRTKAGDCIVITGKGPEAYKHPFQLPTYSDPSTMHYLQKSTEDNFLENE